MGGESIVRTSFMSNIIRIINDFSLVIISIMGIIRIIIAIGIIVVINVYIVCIVICIGIIIIIYAIYYY